MNRTVLLALALALAAASARASLLPGPRHIGALNELLLRRGVDVRQQSQLDDDGALYFQNQLVDHETFADVREWPQKYYLNDEYWSAGKPVFLILGGEGPISAAYNSDHFMVKDLAQRAGAMMVALEHRYYSANVSCMPTQDTDENLHLLTTEQALADVARFRVFLDATRGTESSPVILFGGSYSGSLALWGRLKYPTLFQGAWGTSGPVEPKSDFAEYLEVVSTSVGARCSALIGQASEALSALLFTRQGRQQVDSLFSTCDPVETSADAITLYSSMVGAVSGIVQYNNDNNDYQAFNISTMCGMIEAASTPLDGLVAVNAAVNRKNGASCTESSYSKTVAQLKETGAGRSWMYQCCTAYGFWQGADGASQPFNETWLPVAYYTQMCSDVYGDAVPLTPRNARVAANYGSLGLKVDNVFAPNGLVDPWHELGMDKAPAGYVIGDNSARVLLPHGAHCSDLYPARASDPPSLTAARAQGWSLLQKWIA